ncbi:MAG: RdgB/HAM1 family non-canonical purine NTP pyrophosphatase [Firmicutes bacterium]|nr:RdgB/HAM1 family non-canonical purine NTP pyrophosphatase [Bacillota bacterium]
MEKLIIASNNAGKIQELKEMTANHFVVVSMQEAGFLEDIVEDGHTFLQNAQIKARVIFAKTHCATLSDDSGLCVDALGGEPGVYSARYAKDHDNDANIQAVLDKMQGVKDRRAKFVCAMCYIDKQGKEYALVGESFGEIAKARRGHNGFGYDSIFVSQDLGVTFAEANFLQKKSVSHRARAFEKLKQVWGINPQ